MESLALLIGGRRDAGTQGRGDYAGSFLTKLLRNYAIPIFYYAIAIASNAYKAYLKCVINIRIRI